MSSSSYSYACGTREEGGTARIAHQAKSPAALFMDDLPGDAGNRYRYDPTSDAASEAYEYQWLSNKGGETDIPLFALRMLERLRETGLLHRTDIEAPDNIRRVRLRGKQDIWIRSNTRRTPRGYKAVEVMDVPRSDRATLAAMVAWTSEPVEPNELRSAMERAYTRSVQGADLEAAMDEAIMYLREGEPSLEDFKRVVAALNVLTRDARLVGNLEFLLPLIKHYKPEIDTYTFEEYWSLIEQACSHINNFLESLSRLQAFLEYGAPKRRLTPTVKQPQRDVQAAILSEVEGLSHPEIGKRMKIPLDPQEFVVKGEHQTVRKMIERGRDILEQAFSVEGWRAQVAALREEMRWWQSLSPEERGREENIEMMALVNGVSLDEARRLVDRSH